MILKNHIISSKTIVKFFNERRLRDYPRLIFLTIWIVFIINVVFHRGWAGFFGGIIGVDFVCIYSGGVLYRQDIQNLYNFETESRLQQELFQPTQLNNTFNILSYPPYSAMLFSLFSYLPVVWSFVLWTVLAILCFSLAVHLIYQYLFPALLKTHLPIYQLVIVLASSMPFMTGLFFGQNNFFTLLLFVCILIAMDRKKWYLAGFCGGLLLYKPNFIIGFLIIWFVWRRFKALFSFGVVAVLWLGVDLLYHGIDPYLEYMKLPSLFLRYPITSGINFETTPYALIVNFLPRQFVNNYAGVFMLVWMVTISLALAIYAFLLRNKPKKVQKTALIFATLFPIFISPHSLIYDLIILAVTIILWADLIPSKKLVFLAIFTYLGTVFLPGLTKVTGLSLLSLIPLILLLYFLQDLKYGLQNHIWE